MKKKLIYNQNIKGADNDMYIQEVTKSLNMTKKAIHIYEEKGLIHPKKDSKGYRIYSQEDQKTLLKIKQLRTLHFSIQEIKEILIHKDYANFNFKKEEYQKQIYELETSIQFIDEVKECIVNEKDITHLSHDLERILSLKKLTSAKNLSIDFDKIIICLVCLVFVFASKAENNQIFELIACLLFLIILSLYYSSTVRLWIFKFIEKIKKIS